MNNQMKCKCGHSTSNHAHGGRGHCLATIHFSPSHDDRQCGCSVFATSSPATRATPAAPVADANRAGPSMSLADVKYFLAQGAINIDEGITVVERQSMVHRAMHDLCWYLSNGYDIIEVAK